MDESWTVDQTLTAGYVDNRELGMAVEQNSRWLFVSTKRDDGRVFGYFHGRMSPVPPPCDLPPVDIPAGDQVVTKGTQVNLIGFAGDPDLNISDYGLQWHRDGVPLTESSDFVGVTTSWLTINAVTADSEGFYQLEMTDGNCAAAGGG